MDYEKYIKYCSVKLDAAKCNGCINCIKRCPTEAIRIRNGKAHIMYERCVGCGECIRICPTRAKIPVYDPLDCMQKYKYKVAVPTASIYGQFNNLEDINYVLTGLKRIGFDDVFEAAVGCEIASEITRKMIRDPNVVKPIISTGCAAVIKLIMVRYEQLLPHLSRVLPPEEISARLAREKAVAETGLKPSEIGIFLISPCVANVFGFKGGESRNIDAVLSFLDIYPKLLGEMNKIDKPEQLSNTGRLGVAWATVSGESHGAQTEKYLAADGIENIIRVLEELDRDKLNDLDFIELSACASGCVGGILNIENPFVAAARIRNLRNRIPITLNRAEEGKYKYMRDRDYAPYNAFRLSSNRLDAMQRMMKMEEVLRLLPGLDCGACGAPSCRAFSEDIAKGIKLACKYIGEIE